MTVVGNGIHSSKLGNSFSLWFRKSIVLSSVSKSKVRVCLEMYAAPNWQTSQNLSILRLCEIENSVKSIQQNNNIIKELDYLVQDI